MFQEEDQGTSALVTGGANARSGSTGADTRTSSTSYQAQNSSPRNSNSRRDTKGRSGPNWAGIALGTAAAAATAGAAIYARRQKSDKADAKKFELRLQTDETARLISSAKVEGTPVLGRDGQHLGKIDSFMVDKYTGRVAYAVLSFGGTLGIGGNLFPLPWSALDYDVEHDGYRLNLTSDQLESAPKFKRDDTPEFTTQYRRTVALFYAR
ncbi:PRC-barrel domain-containing protein [uncultured Sphingomonas sp.]|nr:PRC-barrel domain-containing protein [uncultured Sphingomonas sp.]